MRPERPQPSHVSFTQIHQYLRCPLKYRLTYVDRLEAEFVPAALAFGSGIHLAAAFLLRGIPAGAQPDLAEVQDARLMSASSKTLCKRLNPRLRSWTCLSIAREVPQLPDRHRRHEASRCRPPGSACSAAW